MENLAYKKAYAAQRMGKYAIGVDYGTLSARALVAEVGTGRELGEATMDYPHGVMDVALPDGTRLPHDWALQHPQDYLDCLADIIPRAMAEAGVKPEEVVGIGIDCTCCTVLPAGEDGVPLCFLPEFQGNPHAYIKLWKHHAAQPQADRMTAVARERQEGFLPRYGGRVSSEWLLPKLLETLEEAPEVYARACFWEAGDWVVFRLTGRKVASACMAGYKAFWNPRDGYPSQAFFAALNPAFAHVTDRMAGPLLPPGARAGELCPEAARKLGLCPGTAVAVANIDAHVAQPAAGRLEAGLMMVILGTSNGHHLLADRERPVPGICGMVPEGTAPGFVSYEAGQCCVGDLFAWFVDNALPEEARAAARREGLNPHQWLTRQAAALRPGESGLLALDWWNGNRSVLVDADLSGLLVGMTLRTRPEEVYRALIEATAFGTRTIVDAFEGEGLPVKTLCACGGIAHKNPFLLQVYADVLNREIQVARSRQAPALCSAMYGAVAAGTARGGYDSIRDAAAEMGGVLETVYRPEPGRVAVYDRLFAEYRRLHDLFGRGGLDTMKTLRALRREASGGGERSTDI